VDYFIVIATFDISDEIYINHLVDFVFFSWDFTRRKKKICAVIVDLTTYLCSDYRLFIHSLTS
jgi:hypothetical protein